ncbi:GNAT family N-acetyltransferase, partial [Actinoplanes sp. NPDC051633]|uniref:GNAT family N-acetyltransferase n=1 Tax=Actinoplanes sp. NPDC051633 TaxID=3155670 RepID=UPI00341ADAB7
MTVLETERLILRPLRDDDLDALAEMDADPEVMRYIADGSVRDRDEVAAKLRVMTAHWETHGFGAYIFNLLKAFDIYFKLCSKCSPSIA